MPCYDGGYPYDRQPQPRTYHGLTAEQLEAALCGITTVLEADLAAAGASGHSLSAWLASVDWKEVGITRKQFMAWWKAHKASDQARREREERQERERQQAEALRKSALKKLTPAEMIALGLNNKPV